MNTIKYSYNNENIRNENIKKIISALIRGEALSRIDMAKKFKLNKASVSEIVGNLINDGLIEETGRGNSTVAGGRKPILLQINKYAGIACSFEFQYNKYKFMANYINGELIKTFSININISKDNVIDIIKQNIDAIKQEYSYNILGIGIAVHGVVKDNKVIFAPYYDLAEIDIAKELESIYNIPVVIENEANLFAIFESASRTTIKDLIAVNISSGIGAGIITNSLLYKGNNNDAGEIGHTTLYPNGKLCRCGKKGCFEQYCSKQALLKSYANIKNKDKAKLEDIKEAYNLKEKEAVLLLDEYKNNLIIGLGNLLTLLSPEVLVIKSDIFVEFPWIFDDVKAELLKTNRNINITLTEWKDYSTLFGAATLALQNYFDIISFSSYL